MAVGCRVGREIRRAAIDDVVLPVAGPRALLAEGVERGHELRHPVEHGAVDHLPFAGGASMQQRHQDTGDEEHATAAEIGDEIERRRRRQVGRAHRMQRTGQREIIDVVAGLLHQRPLLPPPRHAGIDKAGIRTEAIVRTETQPLDHARPEALDEDVGAGYHAPRSRQTVSRFQVEPDRALVAHVEVVFARNVETCRRPVDEHDVGAEIGEQRCGERCRPLPREFNDPHPCERAAHLPLPATKRATSPLGQSSMIVPWASPLVIQPRSSGRFSVGFW